jgi:thiol-disulfide isomerase/thioredoxin
MKSKIHENQKQIKKMNKTTKFLTVLILSLILTSCNGQDKSKTMASNDTASKIEVIDFYGTHRCMTCKAIEANTKYTLDNYFADEQKKGTVVFKTVNVDKKENEQMAEKFEAAGTALFLNVIKDGKEKHIDLTDFAFMKGNEQEAFSKELKTKIDTELKAL